MEIHELNTFSGTPGSGDYFATDNGTDTSKISADDLFAPLNARIDNIIAGGDAPSESEIVDARLGATVLGSKQYASLGAAIRGQATDLYEDSLELKNDLLAVGKSLKMFDASMSFERGGFSGSGLNTPSNTRIRSVGYYDIQDNPTIYLMLSFENITNETVKHSVSFYTANDFTTARMGSTNWNTQNPCRITVPSGAKYARILFAYESDTTMSPEQFKWVTLAQGNFTTDADLNDLRKQGIYAIAGANVANAPLSSTGNRLLEVFEYDNGAVVQRLTYTLLGCVFTRIYGTDQVWQNWLSTRDYWDTPRDVNNPDLNTLTNYKYYVISGSELINAPITLNENRFLEVFHYPNGAILQRITYTLSGLQFTRLYGVDCVWYDWKKVNEDNTQAKIIYHLPVCSELSFNNIVPRARATQGGGDIAIYNGTVFGFDNATMYVDGNIVPIANGHGNNCNFGVTLHGDFPYLYCGSWVKDDCKIYVNQVTTNSATLIRTINYSTLSGYLNCCVDEPNDRIYILLNTSETPYEGVVRFIVSDLDGNILSNESIDNIPVVQGMTFYNGHIFVTSGDGTASYPNTLTILDTNGAIVSKSDEVTITGEFEGIDFNINNLYIATQTAFYYN